jgi:predicted AAA+ superfamily ATPase
MPAAVKEYVSSKNMQRVQVLQGSLLETYRNDFGKYARYSQHRYLKIIMDKAVRLVGSAFRYVKVDPDIPSRELKNALYLLCDAGIFYRILNNSGSNLPLKAFSKEQGFKIMFLDIGLLVKDSQINPTLFLNPEMLLANRGQLAEQWVGQELLAAHPPYERAQLYYWTGEKTGSMSEIDYLTVLNNQIVPIEVKTKRHPIILL